MLVMLLGVVDGGLGRLLDWFWGIGLFVLGFVYLWFVWFYGWIMDEPESLILAQSERWRHA